MTLVHFLTDRVDIGDPPQTAYRHRVFFAGRDVVALSEGGRVDYVPLALPDVPCLFRAGQLPLEVRRDAELCEIRLIFG